MDYYIAWFQSHLLAVVAVAFTLVLIYHYLLERESGIKLSKKYRNSIFEAQSKVFLNATQYLISGKRDLAIKEFLNAVDINRETIETYFALGGLFRSNGEIEKSISIHRSLIARENITEVNRLRALKELAVDFDKGGFVEKAIETYKDVLKINRDQYQVIQSLCRIYENIEDWDGAYNYRIMLSKFAHENQAETISHILVQKAKENLNRGNIRKCADDLEDAFRFAPSVSAKILQLRLHLFSGELEESKYLLLELLKEHPMYASFIFESLSEGVKTPNETERVEYQDRLKLIREFFLKIDDSELLNSHSVILTKVRLLKQNKQSEEALLLINRWLRENENPTEVMKAEYIKILIELNKTEEALKQTSKLLQNLHQSLTKHFCSVCGYNSDDIFWRCPQCHEWETIQFRWKV
ncbi:MAG: hypothetical protein HN576_11420 [Bacteriovoracaceae bacterium]|jgi:lipopolysaccharide assembly protein B|nr:hypothetical protein [Bacteriovoracaceae bacterium]